MSRKINIFILIAILTFSCKNDSSQLLSTESFSEEYQGNCIGNDCAQVTIDYIKVNGENEIANKINFTVGSAIIYFLNSNIEKNIRASTISEASEKFIKNYENDKKEFPEISPYIAEISVTESTIKENIISLRVQQYSFTGGAHGNGSTKFLNFNPSTGTLISNSSFMKNKKEFTEFVEVLFRKENNISPKEPINSTGFWFENDKFFLPDAIGFTEDSLLIIYNQYEIASYADGPIELTIPLEIAQQYLNF